MKKRAACSFLLSACMMLGCFSGCVKDAPVSKAVMSESLYVRQIPDLPEDFILGMDASSVPSLEAGGVK